MPVYMNSGKIVADGWTGGRGFEGSTRGPRGPKKDQTKQRQRLKKTEKKYCSVYAKMILKGFFTFVWFKPASSLRAISRTSSFSASLLGFKKRSMIGKAFLSFDVKESPPGLVFPL